MRELLQCPFSPELLWWCFNILDCLLWHCVVWLSESWKGSGHKLCYIPPQKKINEADKEDCAKINKLFPSMCCHLAQRLFWLETIFPYLKDCFLLKRKRKEDWGFLFNFSFSNLINRPPTSQRHPESTKHQTHMTSLWDTIDSALNAP